MGIEKNLLDKLGKMNSNIGGIANDPFLILNVIDWYSDDGMQEANDLTWKVIYD